MNILHVAAPCRNVPVTFTLYVMNLCDFTFAEDRIGLHVGGAYLDLHNNYEFVGLRDQGGAVTFTWARLSETWVPAKLPGVVRLVFDGASIVAMRGEPNDEFMEFGFFEDDLAQAVPYQGRALPAVGSELFVVRFENGAEVALRAETAAVRLVDDV